MQKSKKESGIGLFKWIIIVFLTFFYPMLVSIYPFLPPLIGVVGLVIIYTMNNKKIIYPLSAMLYLLNIDLNLALPFMFSILSIIVIYVFVYPTVRLIIRCRVCLNLFLIMMIDSFYYLNLFIYDFILDTHTIVADTMLWFYILIDIVIGFII